MRIEYETLSPNEAERRKTEAEQSSGIILPAVRVRLRDMNRERMHYLFEELGCADARPDSLVFSVERILHNFLHHRNILKRDNGLDSSTSGAAKKTYAAIQRHLSEAYMLLATLDNRSLDLLTPEASELGSDIPDDFNIETFRADVRLVANKAREVADEISPARGRPARDDLFEAIIDLASLYEHASGKKAGYSSRPEKRPGATGYEIHGPFVRFVHRVLSVVDSNDARVEPSPASTIDNAIRRYVDARNSRHRMNTLAVEKMFD